MKIDKEKFPDVVINATLDAYQQDVLASLLRDQIVKNRYAAVCRFHAGKITQAELQWHQDHANYLEVIAEKLFHGWQS